MSHEGIRIVSEEESRRLAAREDNRTFSADAVTPAKVRAHVSEGTGLEIAWRDGHASKWDFVWLRDACPCATCHEARQAEGRIAGEPKPRPTEVLPMYKAVVRPTEATPVGRYAIRFKWNDGHESGIYSWEYLRRHCTCAMCDAERSLKR